MRLTYKYRLFPTAGQRTALERTLGICRWVYNKTLEVRKDAWEERGESLSRYDTGHPLGEAVAGLEGSAALAESCLLPDVAGSVHAC